MPLSDYECLGCGSLSEHFYGRPVPQIIDDEPCAYCDSTRHERRLSTPAPYMGEKAHPQPVKGGKLEFEKAGNRGMPKFPDAPKGPGGDAYRDHIGRRKFKDAWGNRMDALKSQAANGGKRKAQV